MSAVCLLGDRRTDACVRMASSARIPDFWDSSQQQQQQRYRCGSFAASIPCLPFGIARDGSSGHRRSTGGGGERRERDRIPNCPAESESAQDPGRGGETNPGHCRESRSPPSLDSGEIGRWRTLSLAGGDHLQTASGDRGRRHFPGWFHGKASHLPHFLCSLLLSSLPVDG